MIKYLGPVSRLYLFIGFLYVGLGSLESKSENKDPFINLALCEKIASSQNLRLPQSQLMACLNLTNVSISKTLSEYKGTSKILLGVIKKLYSKSLSIQHIDSGISLALNELIKKIIISNPTLSDGMKKDPNFNWVYKNSSQN